MSTEPSIEALAIARTLCPDIGHPLETDYEKATTKRAIQVDEIILAAAWVRAHQYLYYVIGAPIWSDYDYDMFCRHHKIDGHGGSDRPEDYTSADRALATEMTARRHNFPPLSRT